MMRFTRNLFALTTDGVLMDDLAHNILPGLKNFGNPGA
jgi:hypothetical protein